MADEKLTEQLCNLDFIVNHVYFPPKLPQKHDIDSTRNFALCKLLVELAAEYCEHLDQPSQKAWSSIITMLHHYQESQKSDDIFVEDLKRDFQDLAIGGFLILHVRKQNAGLFLHRLANGDVSVASFEASFPNAQVLAAKARIACIFPGPAITLPSSVWCDTSFSHELGNFLYHMNRDELDKSQAHTKKANSNIIETRDVADPKYISELLMGILHGIGSPTPVENVHFVQKRIGDDVLWDNAFLPWRRSPVYLIFRVGLQLALSYVFSSDVTHHQYKAFMAFSQARYLQRVVQDHPELDTDLLYAMRTKVARRIHKLDLDIRFPQSNGVPLHVAIAAQNASNAVKEVLQKRWENVQRLQDQSPEWNPAALDFKADTLLLLKNSRPHILKGLEEDKSLRFSSQFKPQPCNRIRQETDFRHFTLAKLEQVFRDDKRVALADFEYIVHTHLCLWTESNLERQDASGIIHQCMEAYLLGARKIYSEDNPEDQSHMLLALCAMWVSLDKIVVMQIPLLARYSPELSMNILEPLLLRQTNELDALRDIVQYISDRHAKAEVMDGIFTDPGSNNTFYQQYFNSSLGLHLRSLKQDIEHNATQKREECRRLLKEQNAHYHDLKSQATSFTHDHKEYSSYYGGYWHWSEDKSNCRRCPLDMQINSIPDIHVNEWPLPLQNAAANHVCFELDCPKPFEHWRAATWLLLYDIGTSSRDLRGEADQHGELQGSYDLPQCSQPIRFTLATATKSFKGSHYCSRPIPAKEDDVIVNCGSTWKLYEISTKCWAADEPFQNSSFEKLCTPSVAGKYETLQFSLGGTTHTHNTVISAQARCHPDLSLHEFIAFGSLRSGGRLQWMNIAREVVVGDLAFRSESVHTLLLQAAFQVGNFEPSHGKYSILEWHHELANNAFAHKLLNVLEVLMHSVSMNWDAVISLRGIILLTCRIMSGNHNIEDQACQLLRCARKIGMKWITQLKQNLSDSTEEHHTVISTRLCEVAATCRATYSGDPAHLSKLLKSKHDITTLTYCAAIIYENTVPQQNGLSRGLCRLLDRDERLAIAVYDRLVSLLMKDSAGLDEAVKLLWPAYHRDIGKPWQQNDCWITTTTAGSQNIHVNLLDGQLLVEGKPVGRLPRKITNHNLYTRCLRQQILEVIPSDMPAMEYMTRDFKMNEYEIHFGWRNTDNLVIRTRRENEISEMIPPDCFQQDLPSPLWKDYVHWLRISEQVIELYPLHDIWCLSPYKYCITDVAKYPRMVIGQDQFLIDQHSQMARMITLQLEPLEYEDEILVSVSQRDSVITANLPRFCSEFILKDKVLQSKNMPGFCIDQHRSTGTMFGLRNQLVLRPVDSSSKEMRRVLIPHGRVHVQNSNGHIAVNIEHRSKKHADFHEFTVNSDLGYLETNPSLTPRLYKIYLHALTSGRLPDPLTGRTGTEEALLEYSSASCMSFLELREADRDLLDSIDALKPRHTFYPKHLEVMQNILWHPSLPPLSQHSAFSRITNNIRSYSEKLSPLYSNPPGTTSHSHPLSDCSLSLSEKAEFREASYHGPDLDVISNVLACRDNSYTFRSMVPGKSVSETSQQISLSFMDHSLHGNTKHTDLYSLFQEWNHIFPVSDLEIDISYNEEWLEPVLQNVWLSIFDVLRKQGLRAYYSALFTFCAMAYHSPKCMQVIPTFLAFGINPQFQLPSYSPPKLSLRCTLYSLEHGLDPKDDHLKLLASRAARSMNSTSWNANGLHQHHDETNREFAIRCDEAYNCQRSMLASEIAKHYGTFWPGESISLPPNPILNQLFDMTSLHDSMKTLFANCFQNSKLHQFLIKIQHTLESTECCSTSFHSSLGEINIGEPPQFMTHFYERMSLKVLLNQTEPTRRDENGYIIPDSQELANLFNEFAQSPKTLLRLYGEQLDGSRATLRLPMDPRVDGVDLWLERYHHQLNEVTKQLRPKSKSECLLKQAGQWPRITVRTLLWQLSLKLRAECSLQWRRTLTALACDLLYLQRARRLVEFQHNQSPLYVPELEATPIPFVEAIENPDWILIQVESQFTLRELQHTVLREMINPSSSGNTVFQLNMGEGKSSVIVPLAVATLADQRTLVRLVVLKPLARQMFLLLAARLTGLCGRRIFYLPFSRSVNMEPARIRSLLQDCVDVGGILIAQPEHILSLQLLTIEKVITNHHTGATLLELQNWLSKHSRDILDESDEILHSRYQLIYTMGNQQPLEDHPDRWTTIQQMFSLVLLHLQQLKTEFPTDVEVLGNKSGSFPSLRLLEPAPGLALVEWLADDIMAGKLENVNFGFLASQDRHVVRKFITSFKVDTEDVETVKRCFEPSGKWGSVLLLRGLLGHGLLTYVLMKRRWRVDYGLDLKRSLLAVPYRAKDVPSLNAEFGHPDIALLLTCLSYYYQGLNKDQLLTAFQLLLTSDNIAAEYETWIIGLNLPAELRQETGINLEDPTQLTEILLPLFYQAKRVIDFYLSSIVFPKVAKEFPNKLSTSAWDLAEKSKKLKTGFSGTNDNRYLLPTPMEQQDLPGQESSSAMVLSYLKQPENGPCISPDNMELRSLKDLLNYVVKLPVPVRMLFDVGAQVLEINQEVAKMWLEIDSQAQAAVYFDDKDEVSVLTRNGSIQPFIFSPFRNRLGECVVYLDDAHTRGTDLKFPRQARALVTLGEKVTKDRLVQACMRLRQLGHGQSVLFFAPLEIARTIRADADKSDGDTIEVIDILRWAMLRTCEDIEHHIPHWVQQGVDFHERNLAWTAAKESGSTPDLAELSSAWLRPEARTLEQLYLPHSAQTAQTSSSTVAKAHEIPEIQARLDLLGIMNVGDASVDEEQEREVAQEVEQERQLERPPPSKAFDHKVQDEVRSLVRTGNFNSSSFAFLPLFDAVPLAVRKRLRQGVSPWSKQLWATRDFNITIKNNSSKEHMRPVNWLLSTRPTLSSAMNIIILSPYEVQVLLPEIRKSTNVSLHIYSPRIRREMQTFEDLKFFCIPSLESTWSIPDTIVISQLNLFSGQLYFANYDVYRNLCAFLGMGVHFEGRAGPVMDTDGFVRPTARSDTEIQTFYTGCPFVVSPVPFLQELTALRRKGNKFFSTHMGKVVLGRFLTEQHFD